MDYVTWSRVCASVCQVLWEKSGSLWAQFIHFAHQLVRNDVCLQLGAEQVPYAGDLFLYEFNLN